jgi:hypothetical protein
MCWSFYFSFIHYFISLDDVNRLTKCDFGRNIEKYNESFHSGTRKWLSKKVDLWFEQRDSNSQVMILTADAGFGKSTFAAQVCKQHKEKDSYLRATSSNPATLTTVIHVRCLSL